MVSINLELDDKSTKHKRAKTPSILQMDVMECGAVCLAIILAYYGKYISAEQARSACGISRDGSKAINIIKAARHFNLNSYGSKIKNIDDLTYKKTPFIIFWNFNHFMVIEQIKKNKVYINDPATGPRTMSIEEFDKGYTGIALFFKPDDNFKKEGVKEESVFKILLSFLKNSRLDFIYILLITLLLAIPTASISIFIKIFIDHVLIDNQSHWMLVLTLAMISTTVVIFLLTWVQQMYIVKFSIKFLVENVPGFFMKIIHSPMSFFSQRASGDISSRLDIYNDVAETLTSGLMQSIVNVFSITIYILIISVINVHIGIITLCITVINLLVIIMVKRKIIDLGRRISQEQAKLQGVEYSVFQIMEEIKFRSSEHQFFNRWANYQAILINSQQKMAFYNALISLLPSMLYYCNIVILIILGSHLIISGNMTAGGLVAIYTLLLAFSQPIKDLVDTIMKINQLKGDLLRIKDVINQENTTNLSKAHYSETNALLEVKDLIFGYSKLESPILLDINFSLKQGESLAITGASGGGKSSLTNVICGLFEPWEGSVFFKGQNIQSYHKKSLFSDIAYVDQSIALFAGSIRDNISFWDDTVDELDVIEALKIACAYDWVTAKGGLDYKIKEGGSNLSLGQAQRIELARALVRKPELIILDEVTSALDSVTEKNIYDNLRQINCSFIIIAHRLSAIRHCDTILVVDDGMIVESGNHQQLMLEQGLYKQLVDKEFSS